MLLVLILSILTSAGASIWPAPQTFEKGTGSLWIAPDVSFSYIPALSLSNGNISSQKIIQDLSLSFEHINSGFLALPNSNITTQTIVLDAIERTKEKIFHQNFVPWKFHPRNQITNFEPDSQSPKTFISEVIISQTKPDSQTSFKPLAGEVDESYSIKIDDDGTTNISATSYHGVLYALETFSQLFYEHSTRTGFYTNLAPVMIVDGPKFSHRGLQMDVARNWYPVETILKMIESISINKFNRLHIHMTDSQSWPLEIPSLPQLAEKGAYMKGLAYSPDDLTRIQTHGIQRGVEVVIEIDMPGHTTSIGYGYPELITGFEARPWTTYCLEPSCGSLKLNSKEVTKFIENLFADLLPRVSPYSSYFHTGGDEVNKQVYLLDETVRSSETAALKPLMQRFIDHVHTQLRAANVTPVVWEEMALDWNLNLGSDVIVQAWLSDKSVAKATSKGFKVVAGDFKYWYLDCGKGGWFNVENEEPFRKNFPFNDYCSPTNNWRLMYSYDPLSNVPEEHQKLVLGGEVHLWSEQTDPVNLDDMVWPRASAAGEVLWSGRQDAFGQNRSQMTAAPRLAEWRERMVQRGIKSGPVQMIYCTQLEATTCSI